MRKLFFGAVALTVIGAMASCTKTQTTVSEAGKATVVLHLGVNTDLTNDTSYYGNFQTQHEAVPAGTIVEFVGSTRDLQENPVNGYSYNDVIYTGSVDASGDVTIEIPARENAATITIQFPDLELDEKNTRANNISGVTETFTKKEIYTRSSSSISVWDGANIVRKYNY